MGFAMRKCVFGLIENMASASAQSDQGLPCMLAESLDTTEYINGEQMSNDTLCMCRII